PHGRQNTVTDARNGTATNYFNSADSVSGTASPLPAAGQASEVTSNYFDYVGRITAVKQPDNTWVTNIYTLKGELQQTHGSRTYPVGYGYDPQGRMTKMTNWTASATGTGARVTTWNYDAYRGFLTSKTYDGGAAGPSYTYTPAGHLASRAW